MPGVRGREQDLPPVTDGRLCVLAIGAAAQGPPGRHQPNVMSLEEVSVILAEAVARRTLDPGSLLRHLAERGVHRSVSGVAKVLRRHRLRTVRQPVTALASLTAADAGLVADADLKGPFGFCVFATHPGQVVALVTFYVGRLKGVGAVWQLTAVDAATRTDAVQLVLGEKTVEVAEPQCGRREVPRHRPERVLPPALPPRKGRRRRLLERSLRAWIVDYNNHRPDIGDHMPGRTPLQDKRGLKQRLRQTAD